MAVLDKIGGTAETNAQSTVSGYIVVDDDPVGGDVDMEDVDNANGSRYERIIFKRDSKISLNLIVTTGTVATDFPFGDMCTIATLSNYFVDSVSAPRQRGATRVKVELTNISIT